MEFNRFVILRVRYNPDTDDHDFLPTIWGADTREETKAIAERLAEMDGQDSFTVEAA